MQSEKIYQGRQADVNRLDELIYTPVVENKFSLRGMYALLPFILLNKTLVKINRIDPVEFSTLIKTHICLLSIF